MKPPWVGGLLHLLIPSITLEPSAGCHFAAGPPHGEHPQPPRDLGFAFPPTHGTGNSLQQEAVGKGHLSVKPPEPRKLWDCLWLEMPGAKQGGQAARGDIRGPHTHSVTLTCSGGMA